MEQKLSFGRRRKKEQMTATKISIHEKLLFTIDVANFFSLLKSKLKLNSTKQCNQYTQHRTHDDFNEQMIERLIRFTTQTTSLLE